MKKLISILSIVISLGLISCTSVIPVTSGLSTQTVTATKNFDIKLDAELISKPKDGKLEYIYRQKNNKEVMPGNTLSYQSETAFKKIWNSYIETKFNSASKKVVKAKITLMELKIINKSETSAFNQMMTSRGQVTVSAEAVIKVELEHNGRKIQKIMTITDSDYNDYTSGVSGTNYVSVSHTNPIALKANLLNNVLNKSIIYFDNYIRNIEKS
jgi:hypothetical protein